jgi:hypothetical protein
MHTNVKNMVKKYLNNVWDTIDEYKVDLVNGIILDSNIKLMNNENDIVGHNEIDTDTMRMYKLSSMDDNTLYSAGTLILHDDKWICIYEHPDAEYVGLNDIRGINWIVRGNIVKLSNGINIRDMIEIDDMRLNEYISKYLLL